MKSIAKRRVVRVLHPVRADERLTLREKEAVAKATEVHRKSVEAMQEEIRRLQQVVKDRDICTANTLNTLLRLTEGIVEAREIDEDHMDILTVLVGRITNRGGAPHNKAEKMAYEVYLARVMYHEAMRSLLQVSLEHTDAGHHHAVQEVARRIRKRISAADPMLVIGFARGHEGLDSGVEALRNAAFRMSISSEEAATALRRLGNQFGSSRRSNEERPRTGPYGPGEESWRRGRGHRR